MNINAHLEAIAKSYDNVIIGGRDGDPYKNLPEHITSDPSYAAWEAESEGTTGSDAVEITDFLMPAAGMKFIDLGCAANLVIRGYDAWASLYHGVDISPETINMLKWNAKNKNLTVGALHCGSIHETPFEGNFFDIGACIGVLEYFESYYVESALKEAYRILKPNGKFVLDIPNITSPTGQMMMKIEEFLGRPSKFNLLPSEFENIVKKYFEINSSHGADSTGMGILYCLTRRAL